jgi:glycosyltransferase involved in cell wall biosynthesis
MRIGIDATPLLKELSGIGHYVDRLIRGLQAVDAKNSYRVFYTAWKEVGPVSPPSLRLFPAKRLPWPKWFLPLATGLCRWPLPGLSRLTSDEDIVHWTSNFLPPRGSRKQVLTLYDLTFLLFPKHHPWQRRVLHSMTIARSAALADGIIVISHQTKQDVMRYLGVPESKLHVVYPAASPLFEPKSEAQRSKVLSKYRLPDKAYLLFIGNIEPRKNLVRLLVAYAKARPRFARRYRLVVIGGQGWRNTEIFRKADELALEDDLTFLGYVPDEDLPSLISGALAFVYPSLYEGFGLPPLEAMACGTPVVTSDVASLPEVVGDAAVMVDPYDTDALATAIARVVESPDLRQELSERGMKRAGLFSWEKTARQTVKVYEDVYRGSR